MEINIKTAGQQLRMIRDNKIRNDRYVKLCKKYDLTNEIINSLFELMTDCAREGSSTCCVTVRQILSSKYKDILELDRRSKSKRELISDIIEIFSIKFEDVRVIWQNKDLILFTWY